MITHCIKNKKFPTSHGRQYRDFIYVSDLIKIIHKCLINKKTKGHIINVGSGKPINLKEITLKVMNIYDAASRNLEKINLRKDENLVIYPNINKLKIFLSYKPKVPFEKGIMMTIKSYKIKSYVL